MDNADLIEAIDELADMTRNSTRQTAKTSTSAA